MEDLQIQNKQLESYMSEAVEMLDHIKDKLGMFQTQRYYRLKKAIEVMYTQQKEPSIRPYHDDIRPSYTDTISRDIVIENCLTQQIKLSQDHIDHLKKVRDTLLANVQL
jgi:hypothetical protein